MDRRNSSPSQIGEILLLAFVGDNGQFYREFAKDCYQRLFRHAEDMKCGTRRIVVGSACFFLIFSGLITVFLRLGHLPSVSPLEVEIHGPSAYATVANPPSKRKERHFLQFRLSFASDIRPRLLTAVDGDWQIQPLKFDRLRVTRRGRLEYALNVPTNELWKIQVVITELPVLEIGKKSFGLKSASSTFVLESRAFTNILTFSR